jgi:hypothetical protein
MERAELGAKLSQVKTDAVEKEVALGNELHKVKQELRQKEFEMKERLEDAKLDRDTVTTSYKVLPPFSFF